MIGAASEIRGWLLLALLASRSYHACVAKGPTKQHYVPRSYLGGWVDPNTPANQEPYVWVFERGQKKGRKKAPSNLFTETDLYTIKLESGEKVYAIEETLANLEGKYAAIFQGKIRKHLPLSDEEHIYLCAFVSVMLQRTLRHRDNLEQFIDQLIEHTSDLEQAHDIPPKESDGLRRFKQDFHKLGMVKSLPDTTRMLARMSVAFLCAVGSKFITSDDPCALFNPKLQWQRIYGPGLAQKDVELTLPLSPEIMLCMSWMPGMRGYMWWSPTQVEEANRMIVGRSYQYFVSHSPKTKRHWFRRYPLDMFFMFQVLRHQVARGWDRLKMWYRYGRK